MGTVFRYLLYMDQTLNVDQRVAVSTDSLHDHRRVVTVVAWGALVVNLFVILWGAVVRATGSGAGCGNHWPLCNGEVIPLAPTVSTLIEFSHRLTSGAALCATVGLVWTVWRTFPSGHVARWGATLSAITIIVESLLGAGLVLLELVAENRSLARGWWVGAHLVNTLLLLACFTLAGAWSSGTGRPSWPTDRRQHWLLVAVGMTLVALLATGATGAITALGDTLFPATSLAQGLAQKSLPDAHPFVQMRFWHPLIAVLSALGLAVALRALASTVTTDRVRWLPNAVALGCLGQIGIGALNVVLLAPVPMQLLHLAVADLIWVGAVWTVAEVLASPAYTADPSRAR